MLLQNLSILRDGGTHRGALQPAVWDRLLRLPTKFFAERSTGELASAAMGISAIRRVLSGIGPVAVQASTVGAMNLVLLLCLQRAAGAGGARACWSSSRRVFLGIGLWQLRWQRRLVELSNKLNNQAFQTLRGLPKLRVAAAESFAYAAWAREFARSRELQQRVGPDQEPEHGPQRGLSAALLRCIMFMLLAGPARGTHVGRRVPHLQHRRDHAADLGHPADRRARLGGRRAADVRADQAGPRRAARGARRQRAARQR